MMAQRTDRGAHRRTGPGGGAATPWCVGASVAALAALSLACSGAGTDQVAAVQEAADSADQMMLGVRLYVTNQGVRQAYLEADTAFLYEDRGVTELRRVRLTFYQVNGVQSSVLVSDEGTYEGRSGNMEARGSCLVTRADGATLRTEVLRYAQLQNQVSTDRAYTLTQGDRTVRGEGFTSDPSFTNIRSQAVRGSGGSFALPGQ